CSPAISRCRGSLHHASLRSFPTRRSSDLELRQKMFRQQQDVFAALAQWRQAKRHDVEPKKQVFAEAFGGHQFWQGLVGRGNDPRSEEHTSELQSRENLVCRLLLEKKTAEHVKTSRKKVNKNLVVAYRPRVPGPR